VTVYVDDWRQRAAVGRITGTWSHLFAGPWDDVAELHQLAASIGLRRSWYQDKPWPRSHYDVTEARRQAAIAAGAVPVTWREMGRMMADAHDRGPGIPPVIPAESPAPGVPCAQLPAGRIRALTLRQPWATASFGVGIPLPGVAAAACALASAAVLWGCSPVTARCFTEGSVPGCLA